MRALKATILAGLVLLSGCVARRPPPQQRAQGGTTVEAGDQRIRPAEEQPFYWQLHGRPVVLIGGSVEDNLFQIEGIEEHLDALSAAGGNYVRCTLSSRDEGDVWPFAKDPDTGLYDLERFGEEYWRRLERFLELTAGRGIVAQIELWDRFDFAREPWQHNPYNPKNNVNYTAEESGLVERIDTHPAKRESAFFRTVPALDSNETVLCYQRAQVDKLLSISLRFGNVLYCMDNETNEAPEWGAYWCRHIQAAVEQAGVSVQTTEMWDAHDLDHPHHANTFDHPELYSFVDVSQNNHQKGQAHWDNLQAARQRLIDSGRPRPMNCVKVYGADGGKHGDTRNGQQRFWRSLMGGCAAVRFHRPPAGLGLSDLARAHIRSARMLTDAMDFASAEPGNDLLDDREDNEAYCLAREGESCAVFFPDGGEVSLNVSAVGEAPLTVRWLDILRSRWLEDEPLPAGDGRAVLTTPEPQGYWAALVRPAE
jgi:hypothetical protein